MQDDIQLGSFGDLKIELAGGKFMISAGAHLANFPVGMSLSLNADAASLLSALFAAIEKASPAGAVPIEEGVKAIVMSAVNAAL